MIEIIPAIDLIDGNCVRLTQGDFSRKTEYSGDPLDVAKRFEAVGLKRLHIVDLDGARTGKPVNLSVLERIASGTELEIDFGGGIKTEADLTTVFNAGSAIANIGSLAVKQPEMLLGWIQKYGGERILLGADTKDRMVAIDGWQTATEIPILEFLKRYEENGVDTAFVTDVSRDGAMSGPALDLYQDILRDLSSFRLVASGGTRTTEDIDELEKVGCSGVIIGKALYEGRITLEDLTKYVS